MSASADWAEWLTRTQFAGYTDAERADAIARHAEIRDRVLDAARLRPGDDVLDLGAGTGLLTFGAHERIGDGWVYAVDPSVGALEELLRRAHESGAAGVLYLIGDAEVIPLPDGSVDACVTRSVLMYVTDLEAAAGELHRVLRPGGRVSLFEPVNRKSTFIATTVDWSPLGAGLAARVAAEWEEFAARAPAMQLDEEALAQALAGAGFRDVHVELEEREEPWQVDERTIDQRLDSVGAAGQRSLRERWQHAFRPDEVDTLVAHLRTLVGRTLTFRRAHAWVTALRG
jgi:arsenite methyltransferase